ncbi:MAG: thioredoxin domain-containing protein [Flavobacteriales bacterium]|jgi:thioredoxin|nr:thioredoxin domain-containing protein [Flavobacteriales bacterium]|tara:strand:- start:264 stop:983 length:720 start_codon:yes stop_codon:yes gene_type:complete
MMKKIIIYSLISFVFVSCSSGSIEAQVVHNVSVVEFNNLINSNEGIVLDVRTINEVNEGHIKDATNIDFYASDFTAKLDLIRKDVPVYVYCRSGGRSAKTVAAMQELGFQEIYNLVGGFGAWKAEGFKVVSIKRKTIDKQKAMSVIEFSDIIKNNEVVLVSFTTEWCVPCKKMKPVIEEIKHENNDVKVVLVDADTSKELVKKFKVSGVPVFIIFRDGNEKLRHVGMIDKKELMNKIKQ